MDDVRFRSQQSPRNETPMASFVSPPRNNGRISQQTSHDQRGNMPRRFTTDSGRVPTLSSMTAALTSPPRGLGLEPTPDYNNVSILNSMLLRFIHVMLRSFGDLYAHIRDHLLIVSNVGIA